MKRILALFIFGGSLVCFLFISLAADPESDSAPANVPATANLPQTNSTNVAINTKNYLISAGDKLSYRVIEDREAPKFLVVSASGEIEVPYFGRVIVAGKTVQQAAQEIKSFLEKDLYSRATVVLSVEEIAPRTAQIQGAPKQIFVVGQVRMQGPQDISMDEKYMLSRAIIRAGGFGSFANGRNVQVMRKGTDGKTDRIKVDVLSILKDGKLENDIELKPDDMVIVPEKLINF